MAPVGLPSRAPPANRRPLLLAAAALLGALVVGLGLWAFWSLVLGQTGSLAAIVPKDALAFVAVRAGASGATADRVRSSLASAMGNLPPDRLAGAADLAYLLMPGPSASEPVAALLVRGVETVDLATTPELGVKPISGGVLIAKSEHLGRLEALASASWARDPAVRPLLARLPADAPVLAGFREGTLVSLLRPLSLVPLALDAPLLLAVEEMEGDTARVTGATQSSWAASASPPGPGGITLPSTTVLALQRHLPLPDLFTLAGASTLSLVRHSLEAQSSATEQIRGALQGSVTIGVLPTMTPGVRDAVAVFPLTQGADASVALRALEPALLAFGPSLTGAPSPDAAFGEGTYKGVTIRYANFGGPTRAVDYALVNDTLLIATSRESMFALIDVVRAEMPGLVLPSTLPAAGGEWIAVRTDQALRQEFPPALAALLEPWEALVLAPREAGTLQGSLTLRAAVAPAATPAAAPPALPPEPSPPAAALPPTR